MSESYKSKNLKEINKRFKDLILKYVNIDSDNYDFQNCQDELYTLGRDGNFLEVFLNEFKELIYNGTTSYHCYEPNISFLSELFHSSRVCEDLKGKFENILDDYYKSKEYEFNCLMYEQLEDKPD